MCHELLFVHHGLVSLLVPLTGQAHAHAHATPVVELLDEFIGRIGLTDLHARPRCIVVRGNGSVFSSGHDLKELRAFQEQKNVAAMEATFAECAKLMKCLRNAPMPVIGEVRECVL